MEKENGRSLSVVNDDDGVGSRSENTESHSVSDHNNDLTLFDLIRKTVAMVLAADSGDATVVLRVKKAVLKNAPLLKEASGNSRRKLLHWTRRGSPLRALLVISVGIITLIALTGLVLFMLFFVAATINAVVISLLMSLAAAGGFLALFFACVTAVYIGALSVAVCVISTATFFTVMAALITTGWIGFFYIIWLVTKKSIRVAKHSISATGSAISAYSYARHHRSNHGPKKSD